jgi:hypothetical protein
MTAMPAAAGKSQLPTWTYTYTVVWYLPILPLAIHKVGTQPTCELDGDRVTTRPGLVPYCQTLSAFNN